MAVRTILVAEDDAHVRAFLVTALTRAGYQVLEAVDGTEAIAILGDTATVIDVVVSDVDMPGATGLEVVEFASSRRPGIGLVLASGTNLWTADQIPGGVKLLQKPFAIDQLTDAIEAALRS
jgi:DNA-binding NtrC family response regulator